MYTSTARTIDTPPPGTPAYSAYLAARQMALGLVVDVPLEMPPAPLPAVEPDQAPAPVIEEPAPIVEPEPREPYDWTWRGPVASIWPACHPNPAHRYAYLWLADEQRYHCLCCVSLDAQRRREERAHSLKAKAPLGAYGEG